MIIPYKHMNLRFCILNIGSEILKLLKRSSSMQVDSLRHRVTEKLGSDARFHFFPALSLLFLLGAIDCSKTTGEISLAAFSPSNPTKKRHKRKGVGQ